MAKREKPRNIRKKILKFKKIKMQCLCISKPIKWLGFKFCATLGLLSQNLTIGCHMIYI